MNGPGPSVEPDDPGTSGNQFPAGKSCKDCNQRDDDDCAGQNRSIDGFHFDNMGPSRRAFQPGSALFNHPYRGPARAMADAGIGLRSPTRGDPTRRANSPYRGRGASSISTRGQNGGRRTEADWGSVPSHRNAARNIPCIGDPSRAQPVSVKDFKRARWRELVA